MASSPPSTSSTFSPAVASFRSELAQLSSGGVAHRDLSDRYHSVLEAVMTLGEDELVEGLKVKRDFKAA